MRWSWPAFASGVAVGALLCALWLFAGEPERRDEPSARAKPREPAATAIVESGTAVRGEVQQRKPSVPRLPRRHSEDASPPSEPAEAPAGGGAEPEEKHADVMVLSLERKLVQDALFDSEVRIPTLARL